MKIKHTLFTALFFSFAVLSANGQAINITGDQYHLYGPNSTWSEYLQIGGNGQATNHAFVAVTNGNLHLDSKVGFATYINHYNQGNTYINPQGGKVGIGTFYPTELFNVNGNTHLDRLRLGNAVFSSNSRNSINSFNTGQDAALQVGWIAADFGGSDNLSDRMVIGSGFGGKTIIGTHNYNLTQWGGDLIINPTGSKVGIGTTNPTDMLTVAGKIGAREIKVSTNAGADFVFEADYKLTDLTELEKFVKTNKHLPEIPTAKQMVDNGVNLGELNIKLLQKVEELTLHLIEEHNKTVVQEKEMDELKTLLKQQQKHLNEIELKLKKDEKQNR
ncbi:MULTISPECIES: hypothetical protein [unclassified Pedobacter]|uniref:hypothetical protein n=1 Tax=unclassified Pedobacter TaxID=2628915 RepID=UPI001421CE1D|nr:MULTISPECIES: hypothetical protein [unclassified Pedobacter]NII83292.1 hypothetical protein [Pedobacter sp. SG908]NMN37164.1 hypothetical protein [Pedobacter sp. SG918]